MVQAEKSPKVGLGYFVLNCSFKVCTNTTILKTSEGSKQKVQKGKKIIKLNGFLLVCVHLNQHLNTIQKGPNE